VRCGIAFAARTPRRLRTKPPCWTCEPKARRLNASMRCPQPCPSPENKPSRHPFASKHRDDGSDPEGTLPMRKTLTIASLAGAGLLAAASPAAAFVDEDTPPTEPSLSAEAECGSVTVTLVNTGPRLRG